MDIIDSRVLEIARRRLEGIPNAFADFTRDYKLANKPSPEAPPGAPGYCAANMIRMSRPKNLGTKTAGALATGNFDLVDREIVEMIDQWAAQYPGARIEPLSLEGQKVMGLLDGSLSPEGQKVMDVLDESERQAMPEAIDRALADVEAAEHRERMEVEQAEIQAAREVEIYQAEMVKLKARQDHASQSTVDADFNAELLSVAAEVLAPYRGAFDEFERYLNGDRQAQGSALIRPLLVSSHIEYILRKSVGHGNAKARGELREVVNMWLEGYSEPDYLRVGGCETGGSATPEPAAESRGALKKSAKQDLAIENALRELGYDPDNLPPKGPEGTPGLRSEVWAKVKGERLFAAVSLKDANAFRRAWERAIRRGRRQG